MFAQSLAPGIDRQARFASASSAVVDAQAGTSSDMVSTRNPTVEATSDLPNLDLLRTVAVLLVFVGHLMLTAGVRGLGDVGRFGVLLFFVHTSLVLMLSMERLGLTGGKLYFAFLIRRFFRIYPLSVLAVLSALAFHFPSAPWVSGYIETGWKENLSNIFLIQNVTHSGSVLAVLWSLPFEIQMYAILPAALYLHAAFSIVTHGLLDMGCRCRNREPGIYCAKRRRHGLYPYALRALLSRGRHRVASDEVKE